MASAVNWESSPSITSYETTDLNSLADGGTVTGDEIDKDSGAYCPLYLVPSVDGTNYADTTNLSNYLIGVFALDAATTARREAVQMIPVPPGKFKLVIGNETGQAWASSGNTLGYRLYSVESQ